MEYISLTHYRYFEIIFIERNQFTFNEYLKADSAASIENRLSKK